MTRRLLLSAIVLSAVAFASSPAHAARKTPLAGTPIERLLEVIARDGEVPLIVRVKLDEKYVSEPRLTKEKKQKQRADVRKKKDQLYARHPKVKARLMRDFRSIPAFAAAVDEPALRALAADDGIEQITEDRLGSPVLAQTIPIVRADDAWTSPFNVKGSNQVIVVIDSGIDKTHPLFKDSNGTTRVVDEACFSATGVSVYETCPNVNAPGQQVNESVSEYGSGSGVPCTKNGTAINNSGHGTQVAGVAASGDGTNSSSLKGVAPEAKLIAINVASATNCSPTPCSGYDMTIRESSVMNALDYVYDVLLATRSDIVAVNMSIAWGSLTSGYTIHPSPCDSYEANWANAIDQLHDSNVAVVIGTGNDSDAAGIALPACIDNAIAVAATTESDTIPSYSNNYSNTDLLAPGGDSTNGITSALPGGGTTTSFGTSFAAPHVAGAFALLRQYAPTATVDDLLALFIANGVSVTDSRNNITKKRLDIGEALENYDTEAPTAPGNVIATAVSTTSVEIDWTASTDNVAVTSYVVERKSLHTQSSWDLVGSTSSLTMTDSGRTASTTYAYRVRAVDAAQNSASSATDFATTVLFEDDPVGEPADPGGPRLIRGIYVGRLREATDAWRGYAGLSASFGSYAAETGEVDDAYFTAILSALNGARSTIGLSWFSYANGINAPAASILIDNDHVQQLRDAMK